ncbi:TPA: hypothetical protein N0F65_004611 [Lagenidium giganteum]|uniref:HIT-type domain-containing protein n=1 Tax=Lagenidium giganteum TaxID=4803 RepID=A0AAV2ZD24_9STRA|nr:TPA: hypothetical protein N0F65_004611 [Lagenidium giganteum]
MATTQRVPIRLGKQRIAVADSQPVAVNIRLSTHGADGDTAPAIKNTSTARVCRVCTEKEARYTCPRCNAPYCSVACFKTHGQQCTEEFYRGHVQSEMQLQNAAKDDKQAQREMTQLLERVKQFQDESADDVLLADRLQQLALMDPDDLSLDCLTETERAQFLAAASDGRLSRFVMPWEPWWMIAPATYKRETQALRKANGRKLIIEEVSTEETTQNDDGGDDEAVGASPVVIETKRYPTQVFTASDECAMPTDFSTIVRGKPSPLLQFNLIELLFAYALVLRTFNGDWEHDAIDATLAFMRLCAVLADDAKYTSVEHVAHACLGKHVEATLSVTDIKANSATNRVVLRDASLLLSDKTFILDALSDVLAMFAHSDRELKDQNQKEAKRTRRKIDAATKKTAFYRMWVFHRSDGDLAELCALDLIASGDC